MPSPTGREGREVRIHYLRPPGRIEIFRQELLLDAPEVKVTLARWTTAGEPLRIGGRIALEEGSEVVWFTFPGAWHDIGRFHRADGAPTGTYANILTPCRFDGDGRWDTTDLFLDLWMPEPGGRAVAPSDSPTGGDIPTPATVQLLDEDELAHAEATGWVSRRTAARAREEALHLLREAVLGRWPPPVVREWPLGRARSESRGIAP